MGCKCRSKNGSVADWTSANYTYSKTLTDAHAELLNDGSIGNSGANNVTGATGPPTFLYGNPGRLWFGSL